MAPTIHGARSSAKAMRSVSKMLGHVELYGAISTSASVMRVTRISFAELVFDKDVRQPATRLN
jgi:hypothetical protein